MKRLLIFIGITFSFSLYGQNRFNITQYMLQKPSINFASISSFSSINAALLHREQWVGFEGAPSTSMFSFSSPLKSTKLSMGGTAYHDRIGVHAITNVNLGLSYRLKLNNSNFLALAIDGGLSNISSDYDILALQDNDDLAFLSNNASLLQPDFGFSAYFFSKKYYLGISIPSLVRGANYYTGDQLVLPQDFHYFATLGYEFELGKKFDLGVSSLLKAVVNAPVQVDLNAQLMYNNSFGVGLSYRSSDEIATILTFKIKERFTISYSYDVGFSDLARYHDNTHEILLIFDAPSKKILPFSSPRF